MTPPNLRPRPLSPSLTFMPTVHEMTRSSCLILAAVAVRDFAGTSQRARQLRVFYRLPGKA